MTVSIGLCNPKSASNVGSILRAGGCFGIESVFFTGERFKHAKKYHSDTQDFQQGIPTHAVDDLLPVVPAGAKIIVIELVEGATPLPAFVHPESAFYIFGPEDGSVSQTLVDAADAVVYIPTFHNMNLAATANVVLYDCLSKSQYRHDDALIRASRDNNNNLQR